MIKRRDYEATITVCSQNDKGESLIIDETKVYNFDKYTEAICDKYRNKRTLASVDSFAFGVDDEFMFIEFKKARKSEIDMYKKQLKQKAFDSIYIGQFFLEGKYSLEQMKGRAVLYIVYDDDAVPLRQRENASKRFDDFKKKIGSLAKIEEKSNILFDLDIYKGVLYKEIRTIEKKDFKECYLFKCGLYGDSDLIKD